MTPSASFWFRPTVKSGMTHHASRRVRFAICVRNSGYLVSLEVRKVYRVLPDVDAGERGYLRIVDESGEDYLYPKGYFVDIDLPESAKDAVLMAAGDD